MATIEELRLMAKVARMYYERGLNQPEIAAQMDLSQATISRLLKRAQRENIVRISVSMPPGVYADLEEALQDKYGLKEAIVADCEYENEEHIQHSIGTTAAFYLENTVKKGEIIGISSWSATLLAMVDAMKPLPRSMGARVAQILGGIGQPAAELHAARLTNRLANLVRGEAVFLSAPGVIGSQGAKRVLLQEPFVREVLDLFDEVTLALVGIGAVAPSQLLASSGNIFAVEELDLLRERGAVGDICLRFFDREGQPVLTPLNQRVIGISLQQLQKVKRTVGLAGGARKYDAIRGALIGRWINVLVTDRCTAEKLAQDTAL